MVASNPGGTAPASRTPPATVSWNNPRSSRQVARSVFAPSWSFWNHGRPYRRVGGAKSRSAGARPNCIAAISRSSRTGSRRLRASRATGQPVYRAACASRALAIVCATAVMPAACVNAANLLLSRANSRRGEMRLRALMASGADVLAVCCPFEVSRFVHRADRAGLVYHFPVEA